MTTHIKPVRIDDPRLSQPACKALTPVETVHQYPWFSVKNRGGYFTTEYHQSQVIVLPIVDGRAVIMVRAKRPILADATLELPAGSVQSNETAQEGAAREFFEETGIHADVHRFIPLLPMSNSPNRNPELIYIYQLNLEQAEFNNRRSHDREIEAVHLYSFEEVRNLILKGRIFISVPLAILGIYFLKNGCFQGQHNAAM